MKDSAGGSAVLQTLSQGFEIELSDYEAADATLKRDYLGHIVEIVISGIPTVLEVHSMFFFMSQCRLLLQGSISTNLFGRM